MSVCKRACRAERAAERDARWEADRAGPFGGGGGGGDCEDGSSPVGSHRLLALW